MADNTNTARVNLITVNSSRGPENILPLEERRIVGICYDGSPSATYAFDWSFSRVFLPYQDHVYFLVADDFVESDFNIVKMGIKGSREEPKIDEIKAEIENLSKDLLDIGITSQTIVANSNPKKFIPKAVEELKIEALIIGNRGNSLTKRVMFGSVSSYVLNKVSCPVIVVKLNNDDKTHLEDTALERVATRDSLRLVQTISREENPSIAIARSRNRDRDF
ncbi:hypothetical protein BB561_006120 [Smittium simulii]|uniref:UspA domain-containing protein n=1 Tax=Smittium simulii TaxID=133385 RepID=A0A2T9Y6H0_9FUNG|nr:hypothetical protein BB561_006120 [Smittium simulii]